MMMTKRFIAILGMIVVFLMSSMVGAPIASAAGNCYFSSCLGKDPQASGCSPDAITIGYFIGHEIRFSPGCAASWLRPATGNGDLWAQVRVTHPNNVYEYVNYKVGNYVQPQSWTTMVPLQSGGRINYSGPANVQSGWFDTRPA